MSHCIASTGGSRREVRSSKRPSKQDVNLMSISCLESLQLEPHQKVDQHFIAINGRA